MNFILDTNVLINFHRKDAQTVKTLNDILSASEGEFNITFINHAEFFFGATKKGKDAMLSALLFLDKFNFLTPNKMTSLLYGKLKRELEVSGNMIPDFDLWVAAVAVESDSTIITKDRHFEKIPGLKFLII